MNISAPTSATEADRIISLERGLAVLESFDSTHPRQTATEAGRRCGLTRTAAKRYLLTLVGLGYLNTDGKQYWPTPIVLRLGHTYLETARLPRLVYPFLQSLSMDTHSTAQLAILDGDNVIYIARDSSTRSMNTGCVIGERVPAHITAGGLILLALAAPTVCDAWLARCQLKAYTPHTITDKNLLVKEIAKIRQQRYAVSEQQLVFGYRGIAAPLTDIHGNLVGALNLSCPINNEDQDSALARVLPHLLQATQELRQVIS